MHTKKIFFANLVSVFRLVVLQALLSNAAPWGENDIFAVFLLFFISFYPKKCHFSTKVDLPQGSYIDWQGSTPVFGIRSGIGAVRYGAQKGVPVPPRKKKKVKTRTLKGLFSLFVKSTSLLHLPNVT